MRSLPLLLAAPLAVACSEPPLPGLYFDVGLALESDSCNTPEVAYQEDLRYRVRLDDDQVEVAIAGDVFATGSLSGCLVQYTSVAWTETRDAGDLRWNLRGSAEMQRGDGSCGNAQDWLGTETFTVLSSEDPEIRPGCEYVVTVAGSYDGEVE